MADEKKRIKATDSAVFFRKTPQSRLKACLPRG